MTDVGDKLAAELRELRRIRVFDSSLYKARHHQDSRLITAQDPDPKLAKISQDFQEMLYHPLCKRFLRRTPRLVLVESAGILISVGSNTVEINTRLVEALTAAQIKVLIGHELAHRLLCHREERQKNICTPPKEREAMADRLGAFLSGQPDEAQAALDRIPGVDRTGGYIHPPHEERYEIFSRAQEALSTDAGRIAEEAELVRLLERTHRKLFAHQHDPARRNLEKYPHTR